MSIELDCRFIYFGTAPGNYSLALPFPSIGKAVFETERTVDAGRNANNVVVGQMVGRPINKQNMGWDRIPAAKWWEINQWLEANGMFFWCRYFAHDVGQWRERQFYCGNVSCEPRDVNPDTGMPTYYVDATFNIIDSGA